MKILQVPSITDAFMFDYPFHQQLKDNLLPILEITSDAEGKKSNVKADHTHWDFEKDNIQVKKIKKYILNKVDEHLLISEVNAKRSPVIECVNFWCNRYRKGDYAINHHHLPYSFCSFAYFLKTEPHHSPFIFRVSLKHRKAWVLHSYPLKIFPKEGSFVVFPSYLHHEVPVHNHDDERITISGNINVKPNPHL